MARKRFKKSERLSPLLVRLIDAAEHAREDAEGRDIRGAAQALREFGQLALWALPIHGVFVPNNNDIGHRSRQVTLARGSVRRQMPRLLRESLRRCAG